MCSDILRTVTNPAKNAFNAFNQDEFKQNLFSNESESQANHYIEESYKKMNRAERERKTETMDALNNRRSMLESQGQDLNTSMYHKNNGMKDIHNQSVVYTSPYCTGEAQEKPNQGNFGRNNANPPQEPSFSRNSNTRNGPSRNTPVSITEGKTS